MRKKAVFPRFQTETGKNKTPAGKTRGRPILKIARTLERDPDAATPVAAACMISVPMVIAIAIPIAMEIPIVRVIAERDARHMLASVGMPAIAGAIANHIRRGGGGQGDQTAPVNAGNRVPLQQKLERVAPWHEFVSPDGDLSQRLLLGTILQGAGKRYFRTETTLSAGPGKSPGNMRGSKWIRHRS